MNDSCRFVRSLRTVPYLMVVVFGIDLYAAPPGPNDEDPTAALIEKAKSQIQDARFEQCIETLAELPDGLGGNVKCDLLLYRAKARAALADDEGSRKDFEQIVELIEPHEGDANSKYRFVLAQAYFGIGSHEKALRLLNKIIENDGDDEVSLINSLLRRAQYYLTSSMPQRKKAHDDCDRVLKINDRCLDAIMLKGNILADERKSAEAVAQVGDAMRVFQQSMELRAISAEIRKQAASLEGLSSKAPPVLTKLRDACTELDRQAESSTRITVPNAALTLRDASGADFRFVFVPPGSYRVGYAWEQRKEACKEAGDPGFAYNARLTCDVRLQSGFFILDREVTLRQWQCLMADVAAPVQANQVDASLNIQSTPKQDTDLPVSNISWLAARSFCDKFSERFNLVVRLPSEVEWECAARASWKWVYPWGPNESGFFAHAQQGQNGAPRKHTAVNKDKTPSRVYDLAGNVSEWCIDPYKNTMFVEGTEAVDWNPLTLAYSPHLPDEKTPRVCRGGCYADEKFACQIPPRRSRFQTDSAPTIGFRPVLLLSFRQTANPEPVPTAETKAP